MVSFIKSDKLILFYAKNFLFFEWTLEKSDLRQGNNLKSSDFYIGGEKPSYLQIVGRDCYTPFLYFHNPKCIENCLYLIVLCNNRNSTVLSIIRTTDPCIASERIDLLLGLWNMPSPQQHPIKIFCTIRANALFTVNFNEESSTRCQNVVEELCSDFKKILELEAHTDIIMKVDEENIKAHKVILAARSPVFHKMFTHDSKEAAQNKVVIEDINSATMKRVLKFLYTTEMEECTPDELMELYYAADKYEVLSLRDCCKGELLKCIDMENACSLFTLASRHNDQELKKAVVEFVSVNFHSVVNGDHFAKMIHEDVILLMRLCSPAIKNKLSIDLKN